MITDWKDKEKRGELKTNLPSSLGHFEVCIIIEKPVDRALAQPPKVAEEAQSQPPEP